MHLLDRRKFLRGAALGAGSTLVGAMVRGLLPEALGFTPDRRFVVFTHSCGWEEASYTCPARSETDFDLGPAYQTLAPFKKDMIIVSKLYNPHAFSFHGNDWTVLSSGPLHKVDFVHPSSPTCCAEHYTPEGPTLDCFISKQSAFSGHPFPLTAVGPTWVGGQFVPSAYGANQPFPAFSSPLKAYQAWFGGDVRAAGGPDIDKLLAEDRSVLDYVGTDIARVSQRLATPERAKLDQYASALREVERQLGQIGSVRGRCTRPAAPAPGFDASSISVADEKMLSAYVEVTFAAQLCNLTRASHVSIWGSGAAHIYYPFLNLANVPFEDGTMRNNDHAIHHAYLADPAANLAQVLKIDAYILSKVAQMATRMSSVNEGAGTMLSNSVVLYVNAGGGRHHNGHNSHAALLLGQAGGALRTGRYLKFPSMQHSLGDLYVGVANALGVPITTFGDPAICKGPLPGLA